MKHSKQYPVISLLLIIYSLDSVIGTDIYERVSAYVQESDYVDPQSLYYNRQSQTVKVPSNYISEGSQEHELSVQRANTCQSCRDNSYEVFSRRLVNMILSKSNFNIDNGMALGKLELEATVEELEILKMYGEGNLQTTIRRVDDILSNVIRPIHISFFDEAVNFTDRISMYLYQHRLIFLSVLLIMFVIIIALKVRWTRFRVIILLFDLVVIVSFILTWWELLQESEIKLAAQRRIYSSAPDECRQDHIGFIRSMWLFLGFGKGDCLKYYEAVMADPTLKITPLHAFSHMTTKFFFHPMSMAGGYLSSFIEDITSPLPFPFNHIAKLVLVIFMPGLLGTLLIISLGGSMGLRVGPLFHIYLHSNNSETPQVQLENVNRQAIEIIRSDIAEIKSNTSVKTKPVNSSQNSPKKIKGTQTKEIAEPKSNKRDDSDSNGDEFPEEKEYEKVSKVCLEEEINKEALSNTGQNEGQTDLKITNTQAESAKNVKESVASKSNVKNKTSIEVKSKDD